MKLGQIIMRSAGAQVINSVSLLQAKSHHGYQTSRIKNFSYVIVKDPINTHFVKLWQCNRKMWHVLGEGTVPEGLCQCLFKLLTIASTYHGIRIHCVCGGVPDGAPKVHGLLVVK